MNAKRMGKAVVGMTGENSIEYKITENNVIKSIIFFRYFRDTVFDLN